MEQRNAYSNSEKYNTSINVIGGLRTHDVIYRAIQTYFNEEDSTIQLVKDRNEFNIRTERSRIRIEWEIRNSFLNFINDEHKELLNSFMSKIVPQQDLALVLIWQYALNNRLFREITKEVFSKKYFSGRLGISKEDIIGYLKEIIHQNQSLNIQWSELTINTLSTKYLNLMTKFGLLSEERRKKFNHTRPSLEAKVLFLYFLKLYDSSTNDILQNEFFPLSFILLEDMHDQLKKISLKGFLNISYNGEALNYELIHDYRGICDVLYR